MGTHPPTIIGPDLVIRGTVRSSGTVRIDGRIEGEVNAALVVVGEHASVQGDISAEDLTVRGEVQGTVVAHKALIVAGARVEATVRHTSLTVQSGARIDGDFRRITAITAHTAPAAVSRAAMAGGSGQEAYAIS
ncbi:MAG: polymer-forming cytoskeletal protein [Alphaproteobacteria bacterium]|nr:polymer-forming cytoskeletal protein [Alphaproteobacteria bacterium]MBL7096564.1 polymer-forming cytoskeletal protein [Alphaproteobacteria bacterium]